MDSGDLLGTGLGRLALAMCLLLVVMLLALVGLTWVGLGAILGAIVGVAGAPAPSSTSAALVSVRQLGNDQVQTINASPTPPADTVLETVASAAHRLVTGWADRGPLNQDASSSYRSSAVWLSWRDADCSAAALDWVLGAYGQPLASLDDAISLVGPGTGISTSLGLLDARGTPLARALARRGLQPREPRTANGQLRPLNSITELKAWLQQGPLLMDGASWFGEGHWFVGIGYDGSGIYIRDSSGWDTRYLSWPRLYGEVGFSGSVVGVATWDLAGAVSQPSSSKLCGVGAKRARAVPDLWRDRHCRDTIRAVPRL
jgi:hypothetical protein